MPGELEHVVGAAGLLGVVAELGGQLIGPGPPVLIVARAAGAVAPMPDDLMPEEVSDPAVLRVAGQLVLPGRTDDVRDERVDVLAFELVATGRQGVVIGSLHETTGESQVLRLARDGVEIGKHLIHAALLGVVEHLLHLLLGELVTTPFAPAGHAFKHFQGLAVATVNIRFQQPGHDLVQGIVWGPNRLAGLDPVDERLRVGAEIAAVAEGLLAFGQFGDDRIGPCLESLVTHAGVHQGTSREIMPQRVAAEFRAFPAAIGLARGGQSAGDTEHVQQPVRVEGQQVLPVPFHRLPKRPLEQTHVFQPKGPGL